MQTNIRSRAVAAIVLATFTVTSAAFAGEAAPTGKAPDPSGTRGLAASDAHQDSSIDPNRDHGKTLALNLAALALLLGIFR